MESNSRKKREKELEEALDQEDDQQGVEFQRFKVEGYGPSANHQLEE